MKSGYFDLQGVDKGREAQPAVRMPVLGWLAGKHSGRLGPNQKLVHQQLPGSLAFGGQLLDVCSRQIQVEPALVSLRVKVDVHHSLAHAGQAYAGVVVPLAGGGQNLA